MRIIERANIFYKQSKALELLNAQVNSRGLEAVVPSPLTIHVSAGQARNADTLAVLTLADNCTYTVEIPGSATVKGVSLMTALTILDGRLAFLGALKAA